MSPTVVAVGVSYRRPDELQVLLDSLDRLTVDLTLVCIVDNSEQLSSVVVPDGMSCRIEHRPGNLGPAGGLQLGLQLVTQAVPDWEWALLLDDDDPPLDDGCVAEIIATAEALRRDDARCQLFGLVGAVMNRWTGIFESSVGSGSVTDVDFIGGGYLPLLHRSAMHGGDGPFSPALFFGLEELDAGLQIQATGGRVVALDRLAERFGYWDKYAAVRARYRGASASSSAAIRRYYSWRNEIAILGRRRMWRPFVATIGRVALSGGLSWLGVRDRRLSKLSHRAIKDGLRGPLGKREPADLIADRPRFRHRGR